MNEQRAVYQNGPKLIKKRFLLVLPPDLLNYYRELVKREGRNISALMVADLEASRAARDVSLIKDEGEQSPDDLLLWLKNNLLLWLKNNAQKNGRSVASEIEHELKFYRSVAEVENEN